jgi:hypothetical protein
MGAPFVVLGAISSSLHKFPPQFGFRAGSWANLAIWLKVLPITYIQG